MGKFSSSKNSKSPLKFSSRVHESNKINKVKGTRYPNADKVPAHANEPNVVDDDDAEPEEHEISHYHPKYRIPKALEEDYAQGKQLVRSTVDPRLNQKVNVSKVSHDDDYDYVMEDEKKTIIRLKKRLKNQVNLEPTEREKLQKAVKILQTKLDSQLNKKARNECLQELRAEQEKALDAGQLPRFMKKKEMEQFIQKQTQEKKKKLKRKFQ